MERENNPMTKLFSVASISREDLMHPAIGYTMNEARMVSDEQMREIATRLSRNASNQILKSSIKLIADTVIGNKKR